MVTKPPFEARFGLLWVVMITAAENARWNEDIPIPDHRAVGLSIPSIIRPTKVATVEASWARFRGKQPRRTVSTVEAAIRSLLF